MVPSPRDGNRVNDSRNGVAGPSLQAGKARGIGTISSEGRRIPAAIAAHRADPGQSRRVPAFAASVISINGRETI